MIRNITAAIAASAFAIIGLAPSEAAAQRRHHDHYYGHDRYDHRDRYRHRDRDDGDEVAAGVVGLVLGLAIGSLASQPRDRGAYDCRDNYQRCAPPPGYYSPGYYDQGYRGGYYEQEYGRGYYEDPYAPQCVRRERQWDRYARRYVYVDVPC